MLAFAKDTKGAYGEDAFSEDDDIHVQGLQISRAVWILLETAETDEVIRPEKLDLLPRFFHEDIFRSQGMYREHLRADFVSVHPAAHINDNAPS